MEFERIDAEDEIRQMLNKANRDAEEARLRAKGEIGVRIRGGDRRHECGLPLNETAIKNQDGSKAEK